MSSEFRKGELSDKDGVKIKLRLFRRFILIVFSAVFLFSAVSFAGIAAYASRKPSKENKALKKKDLNLENNEEGEAAEEEKNITNVAVFGVDGDGTRTDVIFVASFNEETKDINIVSVPRDTKVTMTEEMINGLKNRNRTGFIPTKIGYGVCKINEIHAYAGEGYRAQYSVMAIEDLLDIEIDYYLKFTTSSFRYVVDAIDGVEFDVPMDMDYEDPEQGLYVHLKKGTQILNGDKAEQLVRFREGYAAKDLERIKVQQQFMSALMKKVLNTETIIKNIVPLTKTVLSYVETDITVIDALQYVKYIKDISVENIKTYTIPGTGGSYFNNDLQGTKELVEEVFFPKSDFVQPEENNIKD